MGFDKTIPSHMVNQTYRTQDKHTVQMCKYTNALKVTSIIFKLQQKVEKCNVVTKKKNVNKENTCKQLLLL